MKTIVCLIAFVAVLFGTAATAAAQGIYIPHLQNPTSSYGTSQQAPAYDAAVKVKRHHRKHHHHAAAPRAYAPFPVMMPAQMATPPAMHDWCARPSQTPFQCGEN